MTANRTLARMRGIPDEDVQEIDKIHEQLDKLMSRAGIGVFNTSVYNAIEQLEEKLQVLWRFGIDPSMHTWKRAYEFKCQWCSRRFQCVETGEEFTIPFEVKERDYFSFGKAAIDVGRLNGYHRMIGNVQEITTQVVQL